MGLGRRTERGTWPGQRCAGGGVTRRGHCCGLRKLTVGDVDASRDARAREGENVQGGEVGGEELVLLEGRGPGQLLQQLFCTCHQALKLGAHGLVHHGHKACRDGGGLWAGRAQEGSRTPLNSTTPPAITQVLVSAACSTLCGPVGRTGTQAWPRLRGGHWGGWDVEKTSLGNI